MRNNPGVMACNEAPLLTRRTIIVTGIGRSGTKAMQSCLMNMGVRNNGQQSSDALDDWEMGPLLEAKDVGEITKEIKRRNRLADVWGFKWHLLFERPDQFQLFRNPIVVCMVRDSVSIACRSALEVADRPDQMEWLEMVTNWQSKLAGWASSYSGPLVMVSYEKMLTQTKDTIDAVAQFCGLHPTDSTYDLVRKN